MSEEMNKNVNEETINVEVTEEQEVETFMNKTKTVVKKYWKPAMRIAAGVAVGLAIGVVIGRGGDNDVTEEALNDMVKDVVDSDPIEVTEF